jgi:SpoU rRNA Methylase family
MDSTTSLARSNDQHRDHSTSFFHGIVTGVVLTVACSTLVAVLKFKSTRGHDEVNPGGDHAEPEPVRSLSSCNNDSSLMDSPALDLRLIRKAQGVIERRVSAERLVIVIERCTNDYNYSAILRTAEALGIQHVYLIDPPPLATTNTNSENMGDENDDSLGPNQSDGETIERHSQPKTTMVKQDSEAEFIHKSVGTGKRIVLTPDEQRERVQHHLFAQNAAQWLTLHHFANTTECIQALKGPTFHDDCTRDNGQETPNKEEGGYTLWVTDLSQEAVCLTRFGLEEFWNQAGKYPSQSSLLPTKLAIVFGTEAVGCSREMLEAADLRVYLPLFGFADSLNLSVATALVIQQLFILDPTLLGSISQSEQLELRRLWFPKLVQQRLLSAREKKSRKKLVAQIKEAERLLNRQQLQEKDKGEYPLTVEQLEKVQRLPEYRTALAKLESTNTFGYSDDSVLAAAVQDMIDHPPAPLTDLRRADIHRVTFAGKNVRKKHAAHWSGIPTVTSNGASTLSLSTASTMRQRVKAASANGIPAQMSDSGVAVEGKG